MQISIRRHYLIAVIYTQDVDLMNFRAKRENILGVCFHAKHSSRGARNFRGILPILPSREARKIRGVFLEIPAISLVVLYKPPLGP